VATEKGETLIRATTVIEWAAAAPTLDARNRRIAEDSRHEVPPTGLFATPKLRPAPYIYAPDELARILKAAGQLRLLKPNPLRRQVYVMLFGLIAATGLRVSEGLNLRLGDVLPGGVLHIRETKFYKSRLVPLHATVVEVLDRYLDLRGRFAGSDDHLFLSMEGSGLAYSTVRCAFLRILQLANIAPARTRRPRIHDPRHYAESRIMPSNLSVVLVQLRAFLAHRRGSESCAQPRCQWPRRRAKNALSYADIGIKGTGPGIRHVSTVNSGASGLAPKATRWRSWLQNLVRRSFAPISI
jgi:integrase